MTDSHLILHADASLSTDVRRISDAADAAASRHVFGDYRSRKAANSRKAQSTDLRAFEAFLRSLHIDAANLDTLPDDWAGMTWGLVKAFVQAQLNAGYAVGTVNRQLSTIKVYAKLANQAGYLSTEAYIQIKGVEGYGHTEGKRVDEQRDVTRIGRKKAEAVPLTTEQVRRLKFDHPDTPQGRRDAFLMCLLLDQGLRVGEVARLRVKHFAEPGMMTFYRPKVDKEQTHRLTDDTREALDRYRPDAPDEMDVPILRASLSNGELKWEGMKESAIGQRVKLLGRRVGVVGLGPHDSRHSWATRAARAGTDPFVLQDAGGWNSLAMPRRYVGREVVSNEGVKL